MAANKTKYIIIDWDVREWEQFSTIEEVKGWLTGISKKSNMNEDGTTDEDMECTLIKIPPNQKAVTIQATLKVVNEWTFTNES